jgi:hypothetical protein
VLPTELFVPHAHEDRAFASQIAEILRRHGIPVWYSPDQIVGAQQWHDEIGRALARCDWFLPILSPRAVESKWMKLELLYALQDDRYEEHILPLLYEPCEFGRLSWTLSSFQRIRFQGDFGACCRELLRTWGLGYREG